MFQKQKFWEENFEWFFDFYFFLDLIIYGVNFSLLSAISFWSKELFFWLKEKGRENYF